MKSLSHNSTPKKISNIFLRNFKGSIMLLVIVFGGIFLMILAAFSGFILAGNRAQDYARVRAEAFQIAEAGLEYYRWFLSHFPGDITNGTGRSGPFVIPYSDPEGGVVGSYTLSITGNTACGIAQSIDVTSTGVSSNAPNISSTLIARYAAPSVASYSYIVGSSVWAGADRIINGPYHSNGGVRMDGTANSTVSSSLSTWNCTSHFGCSPPQPSAPGVVGTGGNQNLWTFPTPQMDFNGIAADFPMLRTRAIDQGIYLPRYSSTSGSNRHRGYRLTFSPGSGGVSMVTVRRVNSVTTLRNVLPIDGSSGPTDDHTLISNETLFSTFLVRSGCGLIFVEDNVWLDGTVLGKVTVVAAGVDDPSFRPNVVLRGNLTYASTAGTDGLTVISARNILIAPNSPQNMTLHGIFVAASGAFGRNFYGCSNAHEPRGTLTIMGTIVSNLRTGTRWTGGCGNMSMGYQTRISAFDRNNAVNPPPFTPFISRQWQFVDWQQK